MTVPARPLSGWGRYPVAVCRTVAPATRQDAADVPAAATEPLLARGNGRSYGDASLGSGLTLETRKTDRVLAFAPETGLLRCEGGLLLADLIEAFVPHGFFVPVTPGTQFVTVGGMIAADVHGKNHHGAGSFCDHVESLDLSLGDGRVVSCSASVNADLFEATCGGMGLTGIILCATIRLQRIETAYISQSTQRARSLDEAMAILDAAHASTYAVAWIDCLASGASLGRSAIFLGEHAAVADLPPALRQAPLGRPKRPTRRVPVDLPHFALNTLSVRLFNAAYYRAQTPRTALVDLESYFYPLDAVLEWNRIYGRRGFVQYQCVLPPETSRAGLTALLTDISRRGTASFLAVLKAMGRQSFGLLSFPMPGYTLALDFPASDATFALLADLDAIVLAHGGRLYLAKDARMSPGLFEAGYPGLDAFRRVRQAWALTDRFRSLQSDRLGL